MSGTGVVHYYDEDHPTDSADAPLCKQGRDGDDMTFFVDLMFQYDETGSP